MCFIIVIEVPLIHPEMVLIPFKWIIPSVLHYVSDWVFPAHSPSQTASTDWSKMRQEKKQHKQWNDIKIRYKYKRYGHWGRTLRQWQRCQLHLSKLLKWRETGFSASLLMSMRCSQNLSAICLFCKCIPCGISCRWWHKLGCRISMWICKMLLRKLSKVV